MKIAKCSPWRLKPASGVVEDVPLSVEFRGPITPAMLITATHNMLHSNLRPTEKIRERLSGVLCRCTGYTKIVEAAAGRHRWADQ